MRYLLIILSIGFYTANAQVVFNTGDVNLDAELNLYNSNAKSDMASFEAQMKASFSITDRKLDYMTGSLHMAPGEIYLALEISNIARVEVDRVLSVYKTDKSKGWGYIAKQVGIKPGSPEFHQLKNNTKAQKGKGSGKSQSKGKGKGKKN